MGLIDHSEKASRSVEKISGTGFIWSGLSGDALAVGVGMGRCKEVQPAIHTVPELSTAAAVAMDADEGSRAIFQS